MKNNQPVSAREIPVPQGSVLVSKTDHRGVITYVNPEFARVSGFSEEELIGSSHNIVRHPDMPPEVFADLWDTLQAGDTWTGLVKNRTREGDSYWVRANVSPIELADGEVGYLSVRTAVEAEDKMEAEALYASVRAGDATLAGTESEMSFWSLERVLAVGLGSIVTLTLTVMLLVIYGADREWLLAGLGAVILAALGVGWLISRQVIDPLLEGNERLAGLMQDDYFDWIRIRHKGTVGELLQTMRAVQIKVGFEVLDNRRLAEQGLRTTTALDAASTNIMMADADYNIIYMNRAVQRMFHEAEQDLKEALPHFDAHNILGQNIDMFHANPAHQRGMLDRLTDTYTAELHIGERILELIANPVVDEEDNRVAMVVEWKDLTAVRAAEAAERVAQEQADLRALENLRIRTALDNVSSCVMMADTDNNIIYMNDTVREMFAQAEQDIRRDLPEFRVESLIGTNIDVFHKNPAHQQHLVAALATTLNSEIRVGGRTFRFTANPVIDTQGNRLGTAVEWLDRTREVAIEKELAGIVAAARTGELGQRVELTEKEGFFKQIGVGINALLDNLQQVVGEVDATLQAMSAGDFRQPILGNHQGAYGRIRDAVNNTLVQVSGTLGQLNHIAEAVNVASDEITAGNNNLSMRTEQQASALQETASSMEELTATVRNNAHNAQQANQVSGGTHQLAVKGGEVVSNAVAAMEEINVSSSRIAEIIGVIDEIAFQTNLLALNASVEAARAGDQGRGFAVVATEVRNLASRSAEAAKEIKELIQDSVAKVHTGSELVNASGETLKEIVLSVKKVGDIVAEIAAASSEQAAGIDQVNQAVNSMEEGTQQNAALAEQTSAASASLYEKARDLERGIAFFRWREDLQEVVRESATQAGQEEHRHSGDVTLDFFGARTAHLEWRRKIRDFLDGQNTLTLAEATSHRDCVLGRWLYSAGLASYGQVPEMRVLEKQHERLHAVIREIIGLKEEGQQEAAETRFSEIEQLSTEIVGLLQVVEGKLSGGMVAGDADATH